MLNSINRIFTEFWKSWCLKVTLGIAILDLTEEPKWVCLSSWCYQWSLRLDAGNIGLTIPRAGWWGEQGPEVWGLGWRVEQAMCVPWDPSWEPLGGHRPSPQTKWTLLCCQEREKLRDATLIIPFNCHKCFLLIWVKKGLEQFLFMRLCWSLRSFLCGHLTAGMPGNRAHIFLNFVEIKESHIWKSCVKMKVFQN